MDLVLLVLVVVVIIVFFMHVMMTFRVRMSMMVMVLKKLNTYYHLFNRFYVRGRHDPYYESHDDQCDHHHEQLLVGNHQH
jgi:hypothetical protein